MKYPTLKPYTTLENIKLVEGESIETRVRKMVESGEPITDTAPLIYTEKKDGIISDYDIRSDKFDAALEALDTLEKTSIAKNNQAVEEAKGLEVRDEQQN